MKNYPRIRIHTLDQIHTKFEPNIYIYLLYASANLGAFITNCKIVLQCCPHYIWKPPTRSTKPQFTVTLVAMTGRCQSPCICPTTMYKALLL